MKTYYVQDCQPNDRLTSYFLVQRKEVRFKKNSGEPYLSLTLSDRTGQIEAKMWDGVEEIVEEQVIWLRCVRHVDSTTSRVSHRFPARPLHATSHQAGRPAQWHCAAPPHQAIVPHQAVVPQPALLPNQPLSPTRSPDLHVTEPPVRHQPGFVT